MRIGIVGAGGVGGYFGARLAAAGQDVAFVARGKHLEALQADGLVVHSPAGDLRLPVRATSDPAEIGPVDYVLICVKTWQLPEAIGTIRPLVGPDTAIVTVQNGVEAPGQVAEVYGRDAVLPGAAEVIAYVESPGVIRHLGNGKLNFGEWDNATTPRTGLLRDAFVAAGLQATVPEDIWAALWTKFLSVVPGGGLGTATGAGYGVLRTHPATRRLLTEAITEIRDIALARGIRLAEDVVPRTLAWIDQLPADGTTSLQRDLIAGRPSELDAWTGAVVRLGAESGVPTPVNTFLFELAGARALIPDRGL
ncbi:2-dehydropantoate 2-reductase [Kribbella sindirgiensis]|uniref:2-dehydropantoate 2-reductase n=1 Tax=Kribbella sindirgiensis TaxID=1124744 RepID=A0A4R0IAC3_9ACTN|nr:2-dehydropantoate 2-reductase [Kribbella sindirgiensis]TCC28784.1 2-dehydropantoate 2-reductase [Kribbella sindirgiensis]